MAQKPYEKRSDLEKIHSQWHKLSGLHTREEWSAAIVRAATAAELSANFAVRAEFSAFSKFKKPFVDSLLRWANGLDGKINRLLIPVTATDNAKHKKMKALRKLAETINGKRNAVAHQGEFCNETEAVEIIAASKEFITSMVRLYEPTFSLKKKKS